MVSVVLTDHGVISIGTMFCEGADTRGPELTRPGHLRTSMWLHHRRRCQLHGLSSSSAAASVQVSRTDPGLFLPTTSAELATVRCGPQTGPKGDSATTSASPVRCSAASAGQEAVLSRPHPQPQLGSVLVAAPGRAAPDHDISARTCADTAEELTGPLAGGSLHDAGRCRPCAFVGSLVGCRNGAACVFCHISEGHADMPAPRPCKGKRRRLRMAAASLQSRVSRGCAPEVSTAALSEFDGKGSRPSRIIRSSARTNWRSALRFGRDLARLGRRFDVDETSHVSALGRHAEIRRPAAPQCWPGVAGHRR